VTEAHLLVVALEPARCDLMCGFRDDRSEVYELSLLLVVPPSPTVPFSLLLRLIVRVVAAVPHRAVHRRVEVDQVRADRVEEGPVVTRHHDHSGHSSQLGLDEFGRRIVEVIGRFVED
jgi:hypothetical protein